MMRSLSEGSVINFICKGKLPPSGQSTFQVLATKKIQSKEENHNASSDYTKYRLCFSDGKYRYSQAVLLIDNLDDVPPDLSIIEIDPVHHKNSIKKVNNKLIFVVGAFKVVEIADIQIGNPVTVPPEAFETGSGNHPYSWNQNQNGGTSSEPVTPTNAPSTSREPPSLPYKRPLDDEENSNSSEANKAKMARRNLFPSKTTHCIKDLNPYQNKYTIQARVIKKSTIKTWNNARGDGTVFDFILKDASGEIKVAAFKELCTKYFDVVEEGKVYYLSNAQIKPIRMPQFNSTNHNYELTLTNHSVIEVEANTNRTNDVPTIEYNFVKVQDIINVSSDDKIDVLGVCSQVGPCVNQTTRKGTDVKKREIQLTDQSKQEIQLTFWADKAEKYDESSLLGKVLALKSVGVSDWNGKSLNCTFGSSLEIDPMNIPGAKDLKDFYHSLSSRDQFQSLTSNDRSAIRPQSQQSDSFVTLKQIHDEFKDASNSHTSSKYYNVCAYVTMIKADKIMYKACPTEKCNKSVVDEGNGNYRCEKCAQSFNNFDWRYILRVAIADVTDYEWITIFDEMAAKIIGKSASDMAKIKEEQDERDFLKILNSSKYKKFNFSIKSALENWNDEKRLRINVMNLELVNYQDPKHIQRLKAEIEALQC